MPLVQADPAYAGARYDHAPCYRIVFAFTDGQPRQWVIDAAPPELRPYIAFSGAKYSTSQREQALREVLAALQAAGGRWVLMTSPDPMLFEINARTEGEAEIARSVIPTRYRSDTRVRVGPVDPIPE